MWSSSLLPAAQGHPPHGAVPSTSRAEPLQQRPGTSRVSSQPQRDRGHTSLPFALQNPLWLSPNPGAANIPPFTAQPGVQVNTDDFAMLDFFHLIFTEDLLSAIVAQCNLYAQQHMVSNPGSSYARHYEWGELTVEEFKIFLDITFTMGLTKKYSCTPIGLPNPSTTCHSSHPLCQDQDTL